MKQSPFSQATIDALNEYLVRHHGGVAVALHDKIDPSTIDQSLVDTLLADHEIRAFVHPWQHGFKMAGHDLSKPGASPDWAAIFAQLLPLIMALIAAFGGGT